MAHFFISNFTRKIINITVTTGQYMLQQHYSWGKESFVPNGQEAGWASLNMMARKTFSAPLLGARDKLMHPIANHYTH
jgi:hypothetical protein